MLSKVRHIIITLVILCISSILVDDGRAIILLSDTIEIQLDHGHRDLDIPHQNYFNGTAHDEELVGINTPPFSYSYKIHLLSSFIPDMKSQDYAGLIWQPPKSE
jgi:hypothetical protein